MSVLLTHLREVIRNNLAQLLSYKDMRALLDRLEPEYRRLIEEIAPSQISYSGLQAVLKLLLAERISIRNLHLILEAIAEIAPHVRRAEQLAEHVRMRLAQQICGDLADGGVLKVLRLGNRWDLAFHQSLKRDAKGEVVEFDIDPRLIEQFGTEASKVIRGCMDQGHQFVLVAAPDARPYVRMVTERLFADAARAVARRDRPRRADQVARHDLVTADRPGHGPAGVPAVLPHRRLPDADAGLLQLARAGAGAAVHRRRRDLGAGAAAAAGAARRAAADAARRPWSRCSSRRPSIGVLIGVMGRMFFLALQFMATAAAMYIGFGTMPGAPIEDAEPLPAFATLITLTATLLFFLTDQHWEVLRALLASYSALPVTEPFAIEFSLAKLTDAPASAFILALQISAPFIVYALIVNLMVGIANKLTPQIPVYFISIPFVLAGGFFLLYFTIGESLRLFMMGFMGWLARG